jgi:DNA polymerase V
MHSKKELTISQVFGVGDNVQMKLPLFETDNLSSPTDDDYIKTINLTEHLIKNLDTTFVVQVSGNVKLDVYIHHGDLLIVDKSLQPEEKSVVIVSRENEFMVKKIKKMKEHYYLVSDDNDDEPIPLKEDMGIGLWGVVTHIIHPTI